MAASRSEVDGWIKYAKKTGAKFIISVCDTYDWDDYSVYCKNDEELIKEYNHYQGKNMQKVNEIIRIDDETVTENFHSLSSALAHTTIITKKELIINKPFKKTKNMFHSKFQLFAVALSGGKLSASAKKPVLNFVNQPNVQAHSIGAQFNEDTLLLTIGYSEKKGKAGSKNYSLELKKLGVFNHNTLAASLEKAADKFEGVICHEIFVDSENEVYALFLNEAE